MDGRASYELHAPARDDRRHTIGVRDPQVVRAHCLACVWSNVSPNAPVLAASHTQVFGHDTLAEVVQPMRLRLVLPSTDNEGGS